MIKKWFWDKTRIEDPKTVPNARYLRPLVALQQAGFVTSDQRGEGKRPYNVYTLTSNGEAEYERRRDELKKLLAPVPGFFEDEKVRSAGDVR